eukprot:1494262-Prymnesium_polylepis.2
MRDIEVRFRVLRANLLHQMTLDAQAEMNELEESVLRTLPIQAHLVRDPGTKARHTPLNISVLANRLEVARAEVTRLGELRRMRTQGRG